MLWYYHMTNKSDSTTNGRAADYLEPVQASTISAQVAEATA